MNKPDLTPRRLYNYSKAKKSEQQDGYLHWRDAGKYDGKELRPFQGRPGAMDAYKLPSRGLA